MKYPVIPCLCVALLCGCEQSDTLSSSSNDPDQTDDCTLSACPDGEYCDITSKRCLPNHDDPQCNDGRKNGDESAIDCGGSCSPCQNGLACTQNADCISQNCSNKICEPKIVIDPQPDTPPAAACSDREKNGDESDVDCGGSCLPCPNDKNCTQNADCESEFCHQLRCATHECLTPQADQLFLNEIFTNPDTSKKMEHSASMQQKLLEIYNDTEQNLRLDNLTLTIDKTIVPLPGCIPPKTYLVLHDALNPLDALTITGEALPIENLSTAITDNGNYSVTLNHLNDTIHAVSVPDMSDKIGISAALPPKNDRSKDSNGRDIMVPHSQITPDSSGDHPYSPGLHNQATLPNG